MAYQDGLHLIPPHMHDAVRLYVERGIAGGSFLNAVMSNKLVDAYSRADEDNTAAMRGWAEFMHWHMPSGCWGSPEKVEAWINHRGLDGIDTAVLVPLKGEIA